MKKINKKLVIGLVLFIFIGSLVGGGYYFLLNDKTNVVTNNIKLELGSELSKDIKDFVTSDDISNYKLDVSGYKDEVGVYKYKVSKIKKSVLDKILKRKNVYTNKIEVVDSKAPELKVRDVSITLGDNIDINSFVEECNDLSECIFKFLDENSFNESVKKAGEYDFDIEASDKYGNKDVKKVHLNVKEPTKVEKTYSPYGNGIAVLNYHFTISADEASLCEPASICMDENLFDEHLKYIKENGFYTASLKELEDYIDGVIDLPSKTVVITIDDGWFVSRAITKLEKYDLHGVLFLIGSLAHPSAYASKNLEIASHTWDLHKTYGSLINADKDTILSDLKQSRESLDNTPYFCYPFYQYNDKVISALQENGFRMAFAGGGVKARRGINKMLVPRYVVNGTDSVALLASYIN